MGLILILMRKKLKVMRIVLAALAGGVASVAQMVIGCCFKPFDLIWTVLMGNFMLFILIGRMRLIELEKGIVYFFTLSFAFTKLYGWGRNLLGGVGISAIFTVWPQAKRRVVRREPTKPEPPMIVMFMGISFV